jgi:hypothetical protein
MSLTDQHKYVIRGIMKTLATNGECYLPCETSPKIVEALWSIFKENWSIVMYRYGSFETEHGYGEYINYDNKWWIYGRRAQSQPGYIRTGYTSAELNAFLQSRFGFAKIADASAFKNAVECQVNERFPGAWKVHLVKFKPGFGEGNFKVCPSIEPGLTMLSTFCGTFFQHDGYRLWVMESD